MTEFINTHPYASLLLQNIVDFFLLFCTPLSLATFMLGAKRYRYITRVVLRCRMGHHQHQLRKLRDQQTHARFSDVLPRGGHHRTVAIHGGPISHTVASEHCRECIHSRTRSQIRHCIANPRQKVQPLGRRTTKGNRWSTLHHIRRKERPSHWLPCELFAFPRDEQRLLVSKALARRCRRIWL